MKRRELLKRKHAQRRKLNLSRTMLLLALGGVVAPVSAQAVWTANAPETIKIEQGATEYKMVLGDTVWAIGQAINVKTEVLLEANDLDWESAKTLPVGRIIRLVWDGDALALTVSDEKGNEVGSSELTNDDKVDSTKDFGVNVVTGEPTLKPVDKDDKPVDVPKDNNNGVSKPTQPTQPTQPKDTTTTTNNSNAFVPRVGYDNIVAHLRELLAGKTVTVKDVQGLYGRQYAQALDMLIYDLGLDSTQKVTFSNDGSKVTGVALKDDTTTGSDTTTVKPDDTTTEPKDDQPTTTEPKDDTTTGGNTGVNTGGNTTEPKDDQPTTTEPKDDTTTTTPAEDTFVPRTGYDNIVNHLFELLAGQTTSVSKVQSLYGRQYAQALDQFLYEAGIDGGLDVTFNADGTEVTGTSLTPTTPVEPTEPTEPVTPVEPTEPTEPVTPVEPTEPSEPVTTEPSDGGSGWVEPTDPTEPVTPVEPTEPSEPVTPVEPTEPVTPVEPTEPSEPVTPAQPDEKPYDVAQPDPLPAGYGGAVNRDDIYYGVPNLTWGTFTGDYNVDGDLGSYDNLDDASNAANAVLFSDMNMNSTDFIKGWEGSSINGRSSVWFYK